MAKKCVNNFCNEKWRRLTAADSEMQVLIVTQWCPNFRFDPPKEAVPNPSQVF
jgi:hypothetical protein